MAENLSIREYSRWLADRGVNVTDVAIGKAIKAGKIDKAIDWTNPKRPKIDPELASQEWGKNYDPSYHRKDSITEKLGETVSVSKPKSNPKPKGKPKEDEPEQEDGTRKSLAEIKRQTAEVKLHREALELKKTRGELVDKQKVYRALFSAGQEVRTAFQSLPDRFIDDILAAKTRNEAHGVLFNAIADTLEQLSEITNRELNV